MPALTSQFLFDVESNWKTIQSRDFAALSAAQNQWWSKTTRLLTSQARKEHMVWVLDTVDLTGRGVFGGQIDFQDMTMLETNFEAEFANAGLKLHRSQFEDTDGNGIQLGGSWMQAAAAKAAYWPQKQIATLLRNGAASGYNSYDNETFFNASHPYNPKNTGLGVYSNLVTSAPVWTSGGTSVDTGLASLQKVASTIMSVKAADGVTPRFLRPKAILCSPLAYPRFAQLTDAKYISMTAGSAATAGGSADIEGHLRSLGYGDVILCPELAGFESDSTYFVLAQAEGVPINELSAGFVYIDRLPFYTTFYTGTGGGTGVDANLDRLNELEWHIQGRNVAGYGHPFAVFKCTE